ncbi:MAG TPA: HAD family hydrolase [Planctomycetota bacterium]|nr:HAD family hydrolase [Planctomycetota bacterium]
MPDRRTGQTLLCDADDTLWENNVYFLDALVAFLDRVEAAGALRATAERTLRQVEAERTRSHGYGSLNFAGSLVETWRRLFGPPSPEIVAALQALGRGIYEHPIETLPGVPETLAELSRRHRLLVVTKGDPAEQASKIERSGLAAFFEGSEILREKDPESYREFMQRRGLDPSTTWMIGNSPRSDMNPATVAGLRTIFIPHRTIWEFEKAELIRPPDFRFERFADLVVHF